MAAGRPTSAVTAWKAGGHPLADARGLEDALQRLFEQGTHAWPALELDFDRFGAHVAQVVPKDLTMKDLSGLSGEGLFLCAACVEQVPSAANVFETVFLAPLARVLSRLDGGPELAADALQKIRTQFFAPAKGQQSAFASYSGRGALAVWLKVLAVRAAQKLRRGAARSAEDSDEGLSAMPAPDADPELRFLKLQHRGHFKACFAEALAGLDARERSVLKMSLIDGLSIDDIGKVYDVHRATAARWLASARQTLVDTTRAKLAARLGVSDGELNEMMGQVQSHLSISLSVGLGSRPKND